MDSVARSEATEKELDSLIRRRGTQRRETEGHRPSEELWAESVRRHHAQHQEALAWQWLEYHQRRQWAHRQTFALLDAHHEAEIQRYERMLGLSSPEPNGHEKESTA